jgi:exodeoxyribonuclease VII large subunit
MTGEVITAGAYDERVVRRHVPLAAAAVCTLLLPTTMKTLLSVPDHDTASALTLGALLDPVSGSYFVPAGLELAQFSAWLPAASMTGELATAPRGISLTQLLSRMSAAVEHAFPRPEWVRIEISSLATKNGHMYLDAVDRDPNGAELSKSRAVIWKREAARIGEKFLAATGVPLSDGMKVLVAVQPQFKGQYGFSLVITDIDPDFTLGDMEARLKRIRAALLEQGIADNNRKLAAPLDFSNVAVIAPDGAAGLGDFQAEADRLAAAGLCQFHYFHATFQGENALESLRRAFIDAHECHQAASLDALIIIRGGGAKADLQWLNEMLLAKMVCRFHVPVLIGIGHERDSTILDEYAHRSFGTPSKVIGHIKEVIAARANQALENWLMVCQTAMSRLAAGDARIDRQYTELGAALQKKVDQAEFASAKCFGDVQTAAVSVLGIASERADANHVNVTSHAVTLLTMAQTAINHLSDTVKDRAVSAMNIIEGNANNDFDAIILATRRSIDGIDDHLEEYRLGITGNASAILRASIAESDRHFRDVAHYAGRMLESAEAGAKDTIEAILAHGIGPTLRRGFAVVTVDGKPISSKALATQHQELEISFHDGSLNVSKKGE